MFLFGPRAVLAPVPCPSLSIRAVHYTCSCGSPVGKDRCLPAISGRCACCGPAGQPDAQDRQSRRGLSCAWIAKVRIREAAFVSQVQGAILPIIQGEGDGVSLQVTPPVGHVKGTQQMIRRILSSVSMATLVALLVGCAAKDPGKETARYEKALAQANSAVAVNQPFSAPLKAVIAKAQAAKEKAQAITDAKEKAGAIRDASQMLSGGLFAQIEALKKDIQAVKSLSVKLTSVGTDLTDLATSGQMGQRAAEAIAAAEAVLQTGAATPDAAAALLKDAATRIRATKSQLEKLINATKAKQPGVTGGARQTVPPKVPTSTGTAVAPRLPPKPPAAAAEWKCAYCGGKSKSTVTKCAGCGAAKK